MPRQPAPDNVRQLRGETRPSRQRNAPKAVAGIPNPPSKISAEAKAEWKRITPELKRLGYLSNIDRAVLTLYCESWARAWEAAQILSDENLVIEGAKGDRKHPAWQIFREATAQHAALAKELGLTPAARGRMRQPDPEPEADDELD